MSYSCCTAYVILCIYIWYYFEIPFVDWDHVLANVQWTSGLCHKELNAPGEATLDEQIWKKRAPWYVQKPACLDLSYWDPLLLEPVLKLVCTNECLVTGPPTYPGWALPDIAMWLWRSGLARDRSYFWNMECYFTGGNKVWVLWDGMVRTRYSLHYSHTQ